MKISITGHTAGLGLGLFNYYTAKGHEVIGFSRTNGYDLAEDNNIIRIVKESTDCDVFINNAFHEFAQVKLLYFLNLIWEKDTTKTHVVIGSIAGDGVDHFFKPYAIAKGAVDKTVSQLQVNAKYRLINIRPGNFKKDNPNTSTGFFAPKIGKNSNILQNPSRIEMEDLIQFIDQMILQKSLKVQSVTVVPN
jgi:NADP-dependent 3-hydroxy acid dehydrogenase YdfG